MSQFQLVASLERIGATYENNMGCRRGIFDLYYKSEQMIAQEQSKLWQAQQTRLIYEPCLILITFRGSEVRKDVVHRAPQEVLMIFNERAQDLADLDSIYEPLLLPLRKGYWFENERAMKTTVDAVTEVKVNNLL